MVSFHGCKEQHSCDICGKEFYLKWRLEKHSSVHKTVCPFDAIGCKFAHDDLVKDDDDEEIVHHLAPYSNEASAVLGSHSLL